MKQFSVKFIATLCLAGAFMLITQDSYCQKSRIQTSNAGDSGITSITKIFEIDAGGLDITPVSGTAIYTVFEKRTADGDWVRTDEGKTTDSEKSRVTVCKGDADAVKVEIKVDCDNCVEVVPVKCE